MARNVAWVAVPQVPPMYPPQEAQSRRGDGFGSHTLTVVSGTEFSRSDEECNSCGSKMIITSMQAKCPNGCKPTDDLITTLKF